MKTINLIIICITILLFVGTITYGITINELYETPYEQCLKTCQYSDKIHCVQICTEEIGKIIDDFSKNILPIIDKILEANA